MSSNRKAVKAWFEAVQSNDLQTVGAWLDRGGNVEATLADGRTALMCAACNENAPLVELLLARGARPGAVDNKGRDALDHLLAPDYAGLSRLPAAPDFQGTLERLMAAGARPGRDTWLTAVLNHDTATVEAVLRGARGKGPDHRLLDAVRTFSRTHPHEVNVTPETLADTLAMLQRHLVGG
jgi:hypothetical protein